MNEIKITIEGLNELTEAIRGLAGLPSSQPGSAAAAAEAQMVNAPVGTVPVQTQQAQIPQTAPMPQFMQQALHPAPGQTAAPSQWTPAQQVPVTAAAQEYTIEQLQIAAAGLTSAGKMPQVMGILQSFGIQAMTELKKEQYGAFAAALREAGAQI